MISLQKVDNAIKFTFTDSQHYLYGDGVIAVPVNSLLLVEDKSDAVTFKKIDGDVFVSAPVAEFGLSKAELEAFYKENMVGSTGGGGIDSGTVQSMIDESISGKADTSAVTAVDNALTAHTANTTIHVTAGDKLTWDGKQDALTAGTGIDITNDVISCTVTGGNNVVELTQAQYDTLVDKDPDAFYIITDAEPINLSGYVQTSAITSSVTSASTDSEIPSAKAVYNAISQSGGAASSAITSGDTNAVAGGAVYDKFDEVEQVTAAALNALNDNFGGLKLVKLTQQEYNNLAVKNNNTLYVII